MAKSVDPRLAGAPVTINEDLLDRALRHKVHLQQYAEGQAELIGQLLVDSEAEVAGKLTERLLRIERRGGLDRGPATTRRLREMMVGMGEVIDGRYSEWAAANTKMLGGLAKSEARFATGMVKAALTVQIEMILPNPRLLSSIVSDRPFEGKILKQWADKLSGNERDAISRALQLGIAQGETVEQLVGRVSALDGPLAKNRHHARAVTRTYVNHVSQHAHEETWMQNGDIIKGVQIVATLDSRTTPICRYQDGRVYPPGQGPRPPFHYNCRTATAPVLKSWKEMGIGLQEIPEGTRASKGSTIGPVPDKLDYAEWFKKQKRPFQTEVLGPTRYKLFAQGVDDVRDYATPQGRLYRLAELYQRFPEEAAAAGLMPAQVAARAVSEAALQEEAANRILTDSSTDSRELLAAIDAYEPGLKAHQAVIALAEERDAALRILYKKRSAAEGAYTKAKNARIKASEEAALAWKDEASPAHARLVAARKKVAEKLEAKAEVSRQIRELEDIRTYRERAHAALRGAGESVVGGEGAVAPAAQAQAEEFVNSMLGPQWSRKGTKYDGKIRVRYKVTEDGRAYCQSPAGDVASPAHTVAIRQVEGAEIVVHELGHALEHSATLRRVDLGQPFKGSAYHAPARFRQARIYGTPEEFSAPYNLKSLFPGAGFEPAECGYRDRFAEMWGGNERLAYYTGKVYQGRWETEIVSMGLQKLYEDPLGFAKADPQFFRFIIGYLKGDIL